MKILIQLILVLLALPALAQQPVDLVVYNGRIFTADDLLSVHSAMAIDEGVVVAMGSDELRERFRGAQEVDLQDRFVVPGFNDSHTHIDGDPRRHVPMAGVASIEEFKDRLRQKAVELGPGEWITGYGWSEDEMEERRNPTRADLDEAVPDNPTVITRAGGHSAVMNSLALQLGGVTRSTPNPEGGVIEKDASGEPNGIIRENWGMVSRLVPRAEDEEIRASLVDKLRGQFAHGITSFTEASTSPAQFEMWRDIYAEHGDALPRAAVQILLPVEFDEGPEAAERLRGWDLRTGQTFGNLRVAALKLFIDGGYTGPAAWTLEHYRDEPDYYGHAQLHDHDLYAVAREAHELGWQMGIHAIGDAAIRMAVQQLARVLEENPRTDHRHYLNHFTVSPPAETYRQMADYNIHIAQQPNFTYTLEGRYSRHLVGERLQTNNPLRTPMRYGVFVALGADILPTGPLLGIYAATTRRGMSGAVYGKDERLSVPEAIVGYTRNGAYLTFEENVKGSLAPGMYADFVVLSEDLRRIDPDRIREVQVLETWMGGRRMYSAGGPARVTGR